MNEQKKEINRNVNRLTRSLFDAGLPLHKVISITCFICDQIREYGGEKIMLKPCSCQICGSIENDGSTCYWCKSKINYCKENEND